MKCNMEELPVVGQFGYADAQTAGVPGTDLEGDCPRHKLWPAPLCLLTTTKSTGHGSYGLGRIKTPSLDSALSLVSGRKRI